MQSGPTMNLNQWIMLVALSVLWGGSFFFTGVAVKVLPPLMLVLLRVLGSAVILNLVVLAQGQRMPKSREVWATFIGMGLLNNVIPFSLIVWGQSHIASGLAAILNATTPLWTVLVAHVFTADEKITVPKLGGLMIGFAGVAVMIGPELFSGVTLHAGAEAAIVLAAFSYGLAAVYGRRFRTMGITPVQTATGQLTVSSLVMLPVALIAAQPWTLPMPGADVWLAVGGMILLSTVLAYILYFRILASAGASNAALVTFLVPVSAILLGILFLGEHLETKHVVGMAMIGAGLAAIDGRPLKRIARAF